MPWQPSVKTPFQTPTAPAREYLRMPEPAMVQFEMWKDKSSGDISNGKELYVGEPYLTLFWNH